MIPPEYLAMLDFHQTTLGRTCGHCGALNCAGHVSLPTEAKHEQAPAEATRDYWSVCAVCGLVKAYCKGH